MDMGSCRTPGRGISKRDKRYAGTTQLFNQRFPFTTVGMKRDIHGVAMVESHAVMGGGLSKCAHREVMTEGLVKIFLEIASVLKRPVGPAPVVKAIIDVPGR